MGLGIGQGAQTLIVFLAGGIPEGELDGFAVYAAVGDVVFKDGRNLSAVSSRGRSIEHGCLHSSILRLAGLGEIQMEGHGLGPTHGRKEAQGKDAEQTRLSAGTVTDNDELSVRG